MVDRSEIVRIAEQILSGALEITEGCRALVRRFHGAGLRDDPNALLITGVDSETDGLPLPSVRSLWNEAEYQLQERERVAYEEKVRPQVLAACRALVAKLTGEPEA